MVIERDSSRFTSFEKVYWKYYRELEKEFLQTQKYVELSVDNWPTYSIEYLKLYQAVCSEIDVIGKAMAQVANPAFKPEDKQNNIHKWWYEVQDVFLIGEGRFTHMNPSVHPCRFKIDEYKCFLLDVIEIQPWDNYRTETSINRANKKIYKVVDKCKTPIWWTDYNKVKHSRIVPIGNKTTSNYHKANLGNVCKAFAALYVLERAYMDTVGTKDDMERFTDYSELFTGRRRYTSKEMDAILDAL